MLVASGGGVFPPLSLVCAFSKLRILIALKFISNCFNFSSYYFNLELVIGLRDSFNKSDLETLFSLSLEGRTDPNCFSKNTLLRSLNHVVFLNYEIDYTPENTTDSNITLSTLFMPNCLATQEPLNFAIPPYNNVPSSAAYKDAVPLGFNAKEREANRLEEGWVEVKVLRRLPQPKKILVIIVQRAKVKDDYRGVSGGGYCLLV
ncbi:hypothetical protein V2W45_1495151 [Cenococcum geophilum]